LGRAKELSALYDKTHDLRIWEQEKFGELSLPKLLGITGVLSVVLGGIAVWGVIEGLIR